MSGLELFGSIGTAVAVVEAILVTASYIQDVKNAKREQAILEGHLVTFNSLISDLKTRLPQGSASSVHTLVEAIENGLADIKGKKDSSGRFKWKFTKDKLKDMWLKLEHMKTFLTLGLVSETSDTLRNFCADNSEQYQITVEDLRQYATEHRAAISDLKTHITQESEQLRAHILMAAAPITDLLLANNLQDVQDWLSPGYSVQNEIDELTDRRSPGSGEWLLESEKFTVWLEGDTEMRVFILNGPAGCGKTVLSGLVSKHISRNSAICLPVFIKYSNKMDIMSILRRLLSATLGFMKSIPEELEELRRTNSFDRAKLLMILQKALASLPNPTYILLDALDELDVSTRKEVMNLIVDSLPKTKLFITSRPLPLLSEFTSHMLDLESSNAGDLEAYIRAEVTAIGRALGCPDAEVDELIARVSEASSELFLLSYLHIRSLRQCQRRVKAKQMAKDLPRTTQGHYHLTIDRIRARGLEDSDTSDAAFASLLWVWKAKQPLTVSALSEAVASVMDDLTGEEVDQYLIPAARLLELCEGLLQVQDETVTFSHVTVLEFFESQETSVLIDDIVPRSIFAKNLPSLGRACLGFLNAAHSELTIAELTPYGAKSHRSFLNYSATFWGDHVPNDTVPEGVEYLQTNSIMFPRAALARANFTFPNPPNAGGEPDASITMSHIAASFNLVAYLAAAPSSEYSGLDKSGRTPLHYACTHDCADSVSFLLMRGVDPNERTKHGKTPLLIALEHRQPRVAKLLLDHENLDPNLCDSISRASPLVIALLEIMDGAVEQLLSKINIDLNLQDNDGDFALLIACQQGKWAIVEQLIARKDVNVNLKDIGGSSTLLRVCQTGNLPIVRLLLERLELDINSRANDLWTPLHYACSNGHLEIVQLLLDRDGIHLNAQGQDGMTSLGAAFEWGYLSVADLLLSRHDISPSYPDYFDFDWNLREACRYGYTNIISSLLSRADVDLNSRDDRGLTPFHLACVGGHVEAVNILLRRPEVNPNDRCPGSYASAVSASCINGSLEVLDALLALDGIAVDIRNQEGRSPFHLACERGHLHVVRRLLERDDVNFNARDIHGLSPIAVACQFGWLDVVELLLTKGDVQINSHDNHGASLLHHACNGGHAQVVKALIGQDALNINARDRTGSTALHVAARVGHTDLVTALLASDTIDADLSSSIGETPLHLACNFGHHAVVVALLDRRDVDPNKRDTIGTTPLHLAAGNGHIESVRMLMSNAEVELDPQDYNGRTPLFGACFWSHSEVAMFLLAREDVDSHARDVYHSSPLQQACRGGLTDVVQSIIASPTIDITSRSYDGETALSLACHAGHIEIVHILLNVNNGDVVWRNSIGSSLLHLAATSGHTGLVELLLSNDHTSNLNTKNNDGHTALHLASRRGHLSVVNCLLSQHGILSNFLDKKGRSPLYLACDGGHKEIVQRLLDNGADPNQEDKDGWSPLAQAVYYNWTEVVQTLLATDNVDLNISPPIE